MKGVNNEEAVPEYLLNQDWLNELSVLLVKHSGLGLYPDIAAMKTIELYGVYQWLRHLSL